MSDSDSDLSGATNFTRDTAKQLPDRELKIGHEQAEHDAAVDTDHDAAVDAERKAAIAEEELERRGTTTT
ncbi:hypothetical protein [Subtercola boreus]|uniref:Uncharacterized protein n=1 Tax=Subtercola boreus TaxID=120213 RepID=A0A3E0W775_9MICO|nr:hypothetical protein [Subtercola boreus]RFA18705.1 hypothetical protein B7R24_14075 [Subtercola boreus]RFA18735.1 hypothetical protein B7R23_14115 [Subtercola boreus]RFA25337.1 hypothetical protein B7R25_14175 [Subtercola boreus]